MIEKKIIQAFLGLLVTRLILYKLFLKSNLSKNPQKWLYGLAFLVGLSAIIWGCALVFLYNRGNSDGVLTLLLGTMAGMVAVATLSYGVQRLVFWSYLIPLSIVTSLYLFSQDSERYAALALGITLYLLTMGYMGKLVENIINRNFILHTKNRTLHGELIDVSSESEKYYSNLQSFLDCLGTGVAMFDENLRLQVWNQAYEKIFGLSEKYLQHGLGLEKIVTNYLIAAGFAQEEAEAKGAFRP